MRTFVSLTDWYSSWIRAEGRKTEIGLFLYFQLERKGIIVNNNTCAATISLAARDIGIGETGSNYSLDCLISLRNVLFEVKGLLIAGKI